MNDEARNYSQRWHRRTNHATGVYRIVLTIHCVPVVCRVVSVRPFRYEAAAKITERSASPKWASATPVQGIRAFLPFLPLPSLSPQRATPWPPASPPESPSLSVPCTQFHPIRPRFSLFLLFPPASRVFLGLSPNEPRHATFPRINPLISPSPKSWMWPTARVQFSRGGGEKPLGPDWPRAFAALGPRTSPSK